MGQLSVAVGTEGRQETARGERGPQMSAGCREPAGWRRVGGGLWPFPAEAWPVGVACKAKANRIPEGSGVEQGASVGDLLL